MISTLPVSAWAAAGMAAYRVEPARTYLPGRRSRLSCDYNGVEELGDMLVLVDQDWFARINEPAGISAHRRPRRGVVTVDHRSPEAFGQLAEQGALAYGSRTIEHEYRLLGEPGRRDINETALRQAS